jgi:hypothetical protein
MSTTIEKQVLIYARALIADPKHWTRSFLGCTEAGHPVAWYDPSAAKWCAMGAIYRGAYELVGDPDQAMRIGAAVVKSISPIWLCGGLIITNDVRGHAATMAKFDRALAAA